MWLFVRKPKPQEEHTTFQKGHVWLAELSETYSAQSVVGAFVATFDFEHFVLTQKEGAVVAVHPELLCFAWMTFGKTASGPVALVKYDERGNVGAVKPLVRAFGKELEDRGLLRGMTAKSPVDEAFQLASFVDFAQSHDVSFDEAQRRLCIVLRTDVPCETVGAAVGDVFRGLEFIDLLEHSKQKVVFGKERLRVDVVLGKNTNGERVLGVECVELGEQEDDFLNVCQKMVDVFSAKKWLFVFSLLDKTK